MRTLLVIALRLLLVQLLPLAQASASEFHVKIGADVVIDLSNRDLNESLHLIVESPDKPLKLLNVSGNPRLCRIGVNFSFNIPVLRIETLDLSGTSIVPTTELMTFNSSVRLNINAVFINGTARPKPPLNFTTFIDLIYKLRVRIFVLDGWPIQEFSTNFSQADNSCQNKEFASVAVRSAGLQSLSNATIKAVLRADFSSNNISEVLGVKFNSGFVDLSHNQLGRLTGVDFQPGVVCRYPRDGPTEVRLGSNALTMAALVEAILSSPSPMVLLSLDLSNNPLLAWSTAAQPTVSSLIKMNERIFVTEWIRLAKVVTYPAGVKSDRSRLEGDWAAQSLGSLLRQLFKPPNSSANKVKLDLSGNGLDSLAAVARVLTAWLDEEPSSAAGRLAELRLLDWTPDVDHLNLTELESPTRWTQLLDLGNLTGSGIRSLSAVVDARSDSEQDLNFAKMQAALGFEVKLIPTPTSCCHAQGSAHVLLFCFVLPNAPDAYRRLICGSDGVDGSVSTTSQPRPPPALILALAALAASLAVLLVVLAIVAGIRRWRKRHSRRLHCNQRSPQRRREQPAEATGLRTLET